MFRYSNCNYVLDRADGYLGSIGEEYECAYLCDEGFYRHYLYNSEKQACYLYYEDDDEWERINRCNKIVFPPSDPYDTHPSITDQCLKEMIFPF